MNKNHLSRETVYTILSTTIYVLIGLSTGILIEGLILADIRRMVLGACSVSFGIACSVWLTLLERFEWWNEDGPG